MDAVEFGIPKHDPFDWEWLAAGIAACVIPDDYIELLMVRRPEFRPIYIDMLQGMPNVVSKLQEQWT